MCAFWDAHTPIGSASKDYAFTTAEDTGTVSTPAYTYTKAGDRVMASGSTGVFELSKCKN